MEYENTLLELIPANIRDKQSGKSVQQAGWAAGPGFVVRKKYDFPEPVSLEEACGILETNRGRFKACHIKFTDKSVAWMTRGQFTRYDADDSELQSSGTIFHTEEGDVGVSFNPADDDTGTLGHTVVTSGPEQEFGADILSIARAKDDSEEYGKAYTVRFKVGPLEERESESDDLQAEVYEMSIYRDRKNGISMEPGDALEESMSYFAEESYVDNLDPPSKRKWKTGYLADQIAGTLIGANTFNTWFSNETY